ncbi:hypothetical protein HN258_15070 [Acinetobacter baumannii]|uniref:hypothetical protein n=1 Tax=Acinetobacter TaxID=469 RepID=UPI0015D2A5FE|nr:MULTISPECIES: hypothetical protein [Acinetobacter]MBF6918455.1 hypothetical protein [Acinetobacter baumannii]
MTLSDIVDEIKHTRIRVCELIGDRYSEDEKKAKAEEVNRRLNLLEKQLIQVIGKSMYTKHD